MTEQVDLDALEALAKAATPGPWDHQPYGEQNQNGDYFGGDVFDGNGEYLLSEVADVDGAHIVAFDPPTVLALIARLREAETVIAEEVSRHTEKHGESPRYAADDYQAEGEPTHWESYVICNACGTDYPCRTHTTLSRYKPTTENGSER